MALMPRGGHVENEGHIGAMAMQSVSIRGLKQTREKTAFASIAASRAHCRTGKIDVKKNMRLMVGKSNSTWRHPIAMMLGAQSDAGGHVHASNTPEEALPSAVVGRLFLRSSRPCLGVSLGCQLVENANELPLPISNSMLPGRGLCWADDEEWGSIAPTRTPLFLFSQLC